MRIERLDMYRVGMPLKVPFRTATGEEVVVETLFVRMRWGGHEGWGEATPQARPFYSSEWGTGAFALLRDCLAPLVLGREVSCGEDLQSLMACVRGNYFAKAALDAAWWDAYTRSRGEPAWRVLGGEKAVVDVGADIPLQPTTEALLDGIGAAVRAGYKRIKLKINRQYSVRELERVREAYPDTVFHVDCNGAFTIDDLPRIQALDAFGFAMIEQPLGFDDLVDHARLQEQIRTPVCLDESITSVARARKALEIGACRWVNIKAGRVGGVTNALAIHELCHRKGTPVWVGSMLESNLGQSISLALSTLPAVKYPADLFPRGTLYAKDVSLPEMALSGTSVMQAAATPGFGSAPDADAMATLVMDKACLAAPAHGSGAIPSFPNLEPV
jgi:O-succinylbenzoate synthase